VTIFAELPDLLGAVQREGSSAVRLGRTRSLILLSRNAENNWDLWLSRSPRRKRGAQSVCG
jgi:hypothetical protein